MTRSRRSTGSLTVVLLCTLVFSMLVPGVAAAAPSPFGNGAAWSVPVRHFAALSPQPNGGVIANTAISNGGVPSGGDALVGINATGTASWNVGYQDQDYIGPGPVVDASGNTYRVQNPGSGQARLIAASGSTEKWSKSVTGLDLLAVGANGQVYGMTGSTLHGYDASDGHELFAGVALSGFAYGSSDKLLAYDRGLVAYSGSGRVWYLGYDGRTAGGPFTASPAPADAVGRDVSASATGELFVVWYTQTLTPEGCLDANGDAKLTKFGPAGVAWTKTLPHITRCNHGGPYVAATPNGGAVVVSHVSSGADVQYVDGSGQAGWHQTITSPAGTYLRGVQAPHVDGTGQVLLAINFSFDCNLWSDACAGVQVSHFSAGGAAQSPIILKGDSSANQQSWFNYGWKPSMALVPGKAVLSLLHKNGGTESSEASYSVDAFNVPGLTGAYPQTVLWKSPVDNPPPPPPPADGKQHGKVTGVNWTVGNTTPLYHLDVTVDLSGVSCPATLIIAAGNWEKRPQICAAGGTAPSQYRFQWKVFDSIHRLPPSGNVSITARIAKSDAPVYGGAPTKLKVPPAPRWIGVGDSFSSGHHQDVDNRSCAPIEWPLVGSCSPKSYAANDPNFSWVTRAASKLNVGVPNEWRYRTLLVAQSGASTRQMFEQGQIDVMVRTIRANAGSWNIVSLTGGANNIDFLNTLREFYEEHPSGDPKPWAVTNWSDCPDTQALYNRLLAQRGTITADLAQIVATVREASSSTRFVDMLYPYVLPTSNVCSQDRQVPTNPSNPSQMGTWHGAQSVIDELDRLHQILAGPDVIKVDLRVAFGNRPLQRLQQTRYFGYPHPNDAGQTKMASIAVTALRADAR